jgi:cytochrome c-type biogenesis protein CcmH/NrfF
MSTSMSTSANPSKTPALRLAALLGLLLLCAAVPAAPAGAQDAEPEGWAYDMANELMSPFCPGRTLADCPSQQAKSLTMWIVVQEAAGRSEDEVREELYARYGEVMRPAPEARGIGLSAYAIPAAVFLGGGLLIVFFLRRQTRAAEKASPAPRVRDPELERIVDEELAG